MFFIARIIFCVFFLLSFPALSEEVPAPDETIKKVEDYLNSLTTFQADFLQIAPDGTEATGKFYLSHPGKFRWQYNPPVPVLITASSGILTYYDSELDQISNVPSASTLAGFLARDKLNLTNDVAVLDVREESGLIKIKVGLKNKPDEGKLTLIFNASPIDLKKMIVEDASRKETEVTFENIETGMPLDNKLFVIVKSPKTR